MRRTGRCAAKAALIASTTFAASAAAASSGSGPLQVPPGCALGIGGPALRAATTIDEARDTAFAALAAERLPVQVTSEVGWRGERLREISDERLSGTMRGVHVAALRTRPGGRLDVLACGPEVDPRSLAGSAAREAWPLELPRRRGCALGVAGRDLDARVRARTARRDALEMLARERETEVHYALSVHGGRHIERVHEVRATERARAATLRLEPDLVETRWLDEKGSGPLGLPGVLYLQLCLPRP